MIQKFQEPIDTPVVRGFGFTYAGLEGPFRLEIEWIGVTNTSLFKKRYDPESRRI